MSPREGIAGSFPRKIAIATRLFGKELQRSKLKWFDLQRADYRLGEKMLAVGVSAENSQFAQRVDQIDDRLTTLRQHERNPSDTFGGKVKSWWKGMIRTVRIAALERQRRSTLKQLGVAVRKSPGPNTSRTSESQAASQIGEKIASIDASIRELRASTYVWARRPLLTSSLVLLLAMVALASFKAQYLQSRVVRRNGAPSSLSEDQFKKIESQTQAFREQMLRQQAEFLHQETEAKQGQIATKSDEQRRDVLRRAQEEVQRQVAAAEGAYKEQQERQRIEVEKKQRETAQTPANSAPQPPAAVQATPQPDASTAAGNRGSSAANAEEQFAKVKTRAQAGDREAMFALGNHYMKGEGVEKDPTEGVGWYRKAADLGHTDAMVELGNAYHNGEGVGKDLNEAFRWNRKAAEGGNSVGMLDIGIQYDTGEGVTKDSIEAARWYRKAADLGHPAAMFLLANSYHMGIGVEKNVSDAFRWYRKAAEAGNTEGMFFAAGFYHEGTGVEKDINEALRWYRKAADAGHAGAMFNLGVHYERGDGVHKDVAEAVCWYRKAVEAGNTRAMLNLGLLYFKGEGVAQDLGEADRWYRKAAAAGDTNAMEALRTLQQVKEDWDNMLVLSDGRHVAVGENGEFKVYKSMADLDPVKLTGAAKEEAKRLLNERQTRAGNGAPSAVPAQPATSSSSGPAWANSYRNAKFITYAELLKRVGPVHLTIRGSDVVSKVVPNLEDLVKTSAAEHGWKLVSEATDFELVVTANIFGSQIKSQQPGFTQIYTISMGIGLRTTANCRRGDKFVRLTVQPYRSYTYYCGAMGDLSDLTRGYAKAFSSCINTLFNGMAEMTDADSKDDEAAWTASLWPPAKDAEMQKNFLAPVQGDPNGSESAFHGITNFALRPVKLVDKAGNYLDARSVEEAWATELSRNGQAIDQSSDARIVDDIGTYWESLSPLGRQGFYMNYCTVNVWQKNVVFKVNGELRRGTVHIWGAEKVVMALPEQQSSEWNLANLSIPLLAKQFALGRLAGGEASDAQTNPQKQEARTAAAQEEAQRLEAEQPQQRETQEQGTKTEALVRAERQSKQDARKAAQAFDQALQRNDMASASSLALGSEKELLAAKAQYDLMQAFARLQLARGKKFGGNQATAPFDPDWKKTDEHLDGEKATVSNGPIIFKTQRVGQTWKVDVRGLDAATSPEALVLSQRLVKDVNEIEAKVERGEYKSEKEVQEGLEAKVAAAAGSGQASSPAIAHSGNDSVQSSRPRSEDSLAVERYLRSQLVGGMTERQIVELSDLIADKINKAGFSTKERGYLFRGTGDQRQFNMLALDGLKRGEQTPAFTKAAAKQLDREINEMFPVRAVFKRPIWPWKALPPIEEPIHQAPWTPGSLVSEHLETFDGAIHQLAEHAIKVEQGYSGKSPKGYAQQVQNLQAGDVLCCKYEGDDGESWSYPYYFWYKEAPPGLQELLKTLPPDHPIRLIGPPLTQAPATLTLAKNANQATAEAAVKKGAPDERAQLDSVLDSRGVDPQLAKLLRPYFHKAADAAHARRADSERIVKSGGAKMLCPKCDGYKLISRRYYDSSRNPYSWGDPMYSIYESQRNGVSFENCDVCGGTGVIR